MTGDITTEFTVWCSDCTVWHQVSAPNKTFAIRDFKENGWKKVKPNGWMCPECFGKLIGG